MLRLGIDIGGTKINLGIIREKDGKVEVLTTVRLETRALDDIVTGIADAAKDICKNNKIAFDDIAFCGIGVPGTVSADGKRVIKAPNLPALTEDFAARLSSELKLPVQVVQDSRAAAWGEYRCGGGIGYHSVLCFTLGTGLGTGIVLDGRLYHGGLGAAGELGHTPVALSGGRVCGCGKRGCLEKYCAGGGLDITAVELLGEGNTARELFHAAKTGSVVAQKAIEEAVERLGNVIVSAVNLLSPDCVLFSGGLADEIAYLIPLIAHIQKHCYATDALPILRKASLGALAPMIGAALLNA